LVYCSITGFGQDGPYAHRPGYDLMIQGMGGIMHLTGEPDREPQKVGVAYADIFTGVYAAVAILAALRGRDATGEGCHVDMALLDTQVSVLANQGLSYLVSGVTPHRLGNAHPSIVPYQVFPVSDGHLIVAVGNDSQFARFAKVIGAPDLAAEPRFLHNSERVKNRADLIAVLSALTEKFSRDALLSALEKEGVPAGPINSLADVFSDAQVLARGMRIDLADPAVKSGAVPTIRSPMDFDGEPAVALRPSPELGADAADVLADPAWGGGEQAS
jgi:crotonobetainyl-CoA:carnitine CoA-transferase CaiB-like acyl-CoA transferase